MSWSPPNWSQRAAAMDEWSMKQPGGKAAGRKASRAHAPKAQPEPRHRDEPEQRGRNASLLQRGDGGQPSAARSAANAIRYERSAAEIFRTIDADGDGDLNVGEITQALRSNPEFAALAGSTGPMSELSAILIGSNLRGMMDADGGLETAIFGPEE